MRMPTRQELERRRTQAIAIINQRPGINQDSLAIALGLPARDPKGNRSRVVFNLIKRLEKSGLIKFEKEKFAGYGELPRLYPANYQKPESRLFQPASTAQCKVYRVPLDRLREYTDSPQIVKGRSSPLTSIPTESFRKSRRTA